MKSIASIRKAEDRYSCNMCKKHYKDVNTLYELNIDTINVCLCKDCLETVGDLINDFQSFIAENHLDI